MPITCFIIDDEPMAIRSLTRLLEKAPGLQLLGTSCDPASGLAFLRSHKVDLLFLDISMERITGLELVSMINNRVVFTTAHADLTNDALAFANTIDYLVKPFTWERFAIALKKIEANFPDVSTLNPAKAEASYPMKTPSGVQNIAFSQVNYIKASGYYSTVYYDQGTAVVNIPLASLEAIFPSAIFVRIHKSCIVNKMKIVKTTYDELELIGGTCLKLSRVYKDKLTL
ncbi:LytR/AlgR family response regulator transcription factor [Taibaiella koreensis]|uniref:LytR/AlgR family response regulator transcription factor n=1 Tax=Taibaiella koreensis TaxID=1268548 RepID=UPI000E59ADC9|nr:LytTR family DNA-binding domain-containing protein [Taibaiella koreensis]